jgi:uncharacterized membrane protein
MTSLDYLSLVLRWLHILSGMTAVGGMIFLRAVLVPSRVVLSENDFRALHNQMRPRWSKIVAIAIGTLLISGLVNFIITVKLYDLPKWYHPVWGVKFLLAMVIFFISSILAGKTALADKFRQNIRFWLNLNIFLAVAVVCLSGVLRIANKVPKAPTTVQTTDTESNAN